MQIKATSIESFLKSPPAAIEGVLIFGRDQGLIRERSKALEAAILGQAPDPFRLVELAEGTVKDAPGALYDEAAAMSMMGGRKFIRLRTNADAAGSALKAYLELRESGGPRPDAFFVIEAGDLKASQALRKSAEGSPLVAALACYPDDASSLETLIDEMMRTARAVLNPDAKAALMERLGSDRGISRQEIDKLLTYCGAGGGTTVSINRDDVVDLVGDAAAADLDRLIDATFSGDPAVAARLSARLSATGMSPVRVLRAVAMHLDRLASLLTGGRGGFGYYQNDTARRHIARWPAHLVARAQGLALEAEIQCKTTGMPAEEICERLLVALARGAREQAPGRT